MITFKEKLRKYDIKKKKLLLFTHIDTDGFSCFIVAKQHCSFVRYFMCDYGNIEEKMRETMEDDFILDYDMVILSDLSVSVEFAQEFHDYCASHNIPFYIIDHHQKAIALNELNYATVLVSKNDRLTCATELLQDFFIDLGGQDNELFREYIEDVRQYDIWDWKITNNTKARDWNTLCFLLPKKDYFDSVQQKLRDNDLSFNENEKFLLKLEEDRINFYVTRKLKSIEYREISGYHCAIVLAEQYINEIAEKLKEDKENDIIIIIGFNGISYRTDKEIDLNVFASQFGGGGHVKASGSTVPNEAKNNYINEIFHLN